MGQQYQFTVYWLLDVLLLELHNVFRILWSMFHSSSFFIFYFFLLVSTHAPHGSWIHELKLERMKNFF